MMRRLLVVTALLWCRCGEARKKTTKDWNSIDFDAVGKDWEDGDEADELKTEHQFYEEALARRRSAASGQPGGIDLNNLQGMSADEIQRKFAHQQSNAGSAMIFITLVETQADGSPWDEAAENQEAGLITALMKTGGINLSAYRIDPRRLLVTTTYGWYGQDIIDFLIAHKTVMKVTWDSVDYENPDAVQADIPDFVPEKKPPAKKKRKKKRAKADL